MIKQVFNSIFTAFGAGVFIELSSSWLESDFLHNFFKNNLLTILIALLAINATTMGVVLTKIRDLQDRVKEQAPDFFREAKEEMLISIKEQICLIISAVIVQVLRASKIICTVPKFDFILNSITAGIFVYSLIILYDTAKSVLVIMEYNE